MKSIELANEIAKRLTNKYGFGKCSVWDKKGNELRVYAGKNNGYVEITSKISLHKVKGYLKEITNEINDLIEIECESLNDKNFEDPTPSQLAQVYGWSEVIDTQNDVARDDWDI